MLPSDDKFKINLPLFENFPVPLIKVVFHYLNPILNGSPPIK